MAGTCAIVLGKFSDLADEPQPRSFYEAYFTDVGSGTGGALDYWRDVTHGMVDLRGSTVFGWVDIGHATSELADLTFPQDRSTLWRWGADAAQAAGIVLTGYSAVVVVLNTATDHGSAGGNRVVFGYPAGVWEPTFVAHELGHAFGLDHSWSADPDRVYGDRWDIMSAMNVWTFTGHYGSPTGPGLNAPYLSRLGALPASRTWTPSTTVPSATLQLAPLGDVSLPGSLAVRVPRGFLRPAQDRDYWVEYRSRSGWDKGVPPAVLVHEVRGDGLSYLLAPVLAVVGDTFRAPSGDLAVVLLTAPETGQPVDIRVDVTVEVEPSRCSDIRAEIAGLQAERESLQDELRHAAPAEKPFIVAQVRRVNRTIARLEAESTTLGCR